MIDREALQAFLSLDALLFLPGAAWIHRVHHRIAAWARQVPV